MFGDDTRSGRVLFSRIGLLHKRHYHLRPTSVLRMHLFIIYSVTRSKRIEGLSRIRCPICFSLIPACIGLGCGLWIGMDRHSKNNAGMLVGVMMLSRIFKTIVSTSNVVGLGMLIGVSTRPGFSMLFLCEMDGRSKTATACWWVLMIVSLILQFWCSDKNHRQK
jgi:FtsH-binding integral membrane protein